MQGRNAHGTTGVHGGHPSLVDRVVLAFVNRGYRIVDYTDVKGCVDLVARSEGHVFVVRVLSNVDALREESVEEFVRLAAAVSGTPIIVGERTKRGPLEDGVVYRRYGVSVVTLQTLEYILDGELPIYEEFKGKRVVYLDPVALRSARESLGLSQNDLAREVGTTKESIYRYEHGFPASEKTARRLVRILGKDIISSVNIDFRGDVRRSEFFEFRRAPWDLFISIRQSLAISKARGILQRKIEILRRGMGVVHDYYAVMSPTDEEIPGVPTITQEDLHEARSPKDIVRKVRDEFEDLKE